MSKFTAIFLGTDCDPRPIFRDEYSEVAWPDGAVMAVTFSAKDFPHVGAQPGDDRLPLIEFYGEDGWPLELAPAHKLELSGVMKREFQVYPWGWRRWSEHGWTHAKRFAISFKNARVQGRIIRALAGATSALARDVA